MVDVEGTEPNGQSALPLVHQALTAFPFAMLLLLYLLAFRATALLGRWPRVGLDDPKWMGMDDGVYRTVLYTLSNCFAPTLFLGMLLWLALMALQYQSYSVRRRWLLPIIYCVGWALIYFAPGRVLWWWLD